MSSTLRASAASRAFLFASVAAIAIATAGTASALPQNPNVVASTGGGGATFDYGTLNTLNVNQVDRRVVINWDAFNIASGETVNFNQSRADSIAFNVVTGYEGGYMPPGLSTIDGNLNAGGGVWLFSSGGILIGSNARVNVGTFGAVTGEIAGEGGVEQLLYADEGTGLTYVSLAPAFYKDGGPAGLTIESGAQITARSGFVLLQSESMIDNGQITAADGIQYIVGEGGEVSFTTNTTRQILMSANATTLNGRGQPSFSHGGGTTRANWIAISALGSQSESDYHGIINLDGVFQASGIRPGSGNKGIVLLVGGDQGPLEAGATGSTLEIDASGSSMTSNAGLLLRADKATLGVVNLGGVLDTNTYGDMTLAGTTNVSGDATLTHNNLSGFSNGSVIMDGHVTVGGDLDARGYNVNTNNKLDVTGNANVRAVANIVFDGITKIDGSATLTTFGQGNGVAIRKTFGVGGNFDVTTNGFRNFAPVTVGGESDVDSFGDIRLDGDFHAGSDAAFNVTGPQGVLINNHAMSANGHLFITANAVTSNGSIASGGDLDISSNGIVALNGPVTSNGQIDIFTPGAVTVAGAMTSENGTDVHAGSFASTSAGVLDVGGNLTIATASGLTLGGAATVSDGALLTGSGPGATQALNAALTVGGDLTVTGAVNTVGSGAVVQANGQAYLASSGNTTIAGQVTAHDLGVYAQGDLTVAATGALTATATAAAPTWPTVQSNAQWGEASVPNLNGLTLAAHTMTLNGSVTSGPANGRSEVFIQPLGTQSSVIIGGTDGAGFRLTNASLGKINARNLIFLGGYGEGDGAGYDLTVADLTVDTAKLGGLWLGTQSGHNINVSGVVSGGGVVRLGFVQMDGQEGSDNIDTDALGGDTFAYIPGDIAITTGSLGTSASPLAVVSLIARNNIFMGSEGFITAAKADNAFDAVARSKEFATLPANHLFVSAGTLEMAAQGRIIQQNTAAGTVRFAGISINTPGADHPLISSASVLEGTSFGSGANAWTAHFNTGPTRIDLFGVLITGVNTSINDEAAAKQSNLLASLIAEAPGYRINSCVFGATCAAPTTDVETPRFEAPLVVDILNDTTVLDAAAQAAAAGSSGSPTSFTIQSNTEQDEGQGTNQAPITGSGNGDLWPAAGTP